MASQTTAPEIIVVHAREIVVHERVGVDAFHRAGERKRVVDLAVARFGGGQAKNRPEPFAPGKQAVTHRFVDRDRLDALFWKIAIEGAVDLLLPCTEITFQIHRLSTVDV